MRSAPSRSSLLNGYNSVATVTLQSLMMMMMTIMAVSLLSSLLPSSLGRAGLTP